MPDLASAASARRQHIFPLVPIFCITAISFRACVLPMAQALVGTERVSTSDGDSCVQFWLLGPKL